MSVSFDQEGVAEERRRRIVQALAAWTSIQKQGAHTDLRRTFVNNIYYLAKLWLISSNKLSLFE